MLVVGRPGSGCTTFLKTLANKRAGYVAVEGNVQYANMDHIEAANYRQQILYNSEGITGTSLHHICILMKK